jgi:hypothetical protein
MDFGSVLGLVVVIAALLAINLTSKKTKHTPYRGTT